jgi:uncharacterized RDD family membrane protein YckC
VAILNCENCGVEIPDGTSACARCGTPVTVAQLGSISVPLSAPPLEETSRAPETPAAAWQPLYAGFWLRSVAFAIDVFLMFSAILLIASFFPAKFEKLFPPVTSVTSLADLPQPSPAVFLGLALFGCVYFAIFEGSIWQATLGKRIMRLYVTDLRGQRITFARALLRNLARQLSGIFFIGYVMVGFTEKKQALHDLLASTLVLRRR